MYNEVNIDPLTKGNFHFALEIKGYGLLVQDQYINVYLTINKEGNNFTFFANLLITRLKASTSS
ncbi:hypothetical protein CEY02_08695 [Bacillus pumilus]|uniref:Uncharacterized protein n=1 Tax=Bacillus pumilus TaxID=1408 RepID=A0A2A5IW42_BACPU|nr:hypothetical protein CEY02_08695 [Bacillus pumilus]